MFWRGFGPAAIELVGSTLRLASASALPFGYSSVAQPRLNRQMCYSNFKCLHSRRVFSLDSNESLSNESQSVSKSLILHFFFLISHVKKTESVPVDGVN